MDCYPFRQDHTGCLVTQIGVLGVSDPLLLADWLEYSKQKVLTLLQDNISTTLHNILQHDEHNGVCDKSSEEAFIHVQLDVIQVLGRYNVSFFNAIRENFQNLSNLNPILQSL